MKVLYIKSLLALSIEFTNLVDPPRPELSLALIDHLREENMPPKLLKEPALKVASIGGKTYKNIERNLFHLFLQEVFVDILTSELISSPTFYSEAFTPWYQLLKQIIDSRFFSRHTNLFQPAQIAIIFLAMNDEDTSHDKSQFDYIVRVAVECIGKVKDEQTSEFLMQLR